MPMPIPTPLIDPSFPHAWVAEILSARPLILPQRHFVYPREVEEVERGALEVLVRPMFLRPPAGELAEESRPEESPFAKGPGAPGLDFQTWKSDEPQPVLAPFLATCALGFRDPAAPTGVWSCPHPKELCAVAGGYAYIIDTAAPERFTMLPYRPLLEVRSLPANGLLLFVGHRSILAWGVQGLAWESAKLSDEGVTITGVEGNVLHGLGWHMMTDKETPFAIDLKTGSSATG